MTDTKLARYWRYYQRSLFPVFEEPEDAATEGIQRLYHVLDTLQMGKYFQPQGNDGGGSTLERSPGNVAVICCKSSAQYSNNQSLH